MPRGKNTNVYLSCKGTLKKDNGQAKAKKSKKDDSQLKHNSDGCGMQNYKTRINKRTINGKLERMKYCPKCKVSMVHVSGSEIKHSS